MGKRYRAVGRFATAGAVAGDFADQPVTGIRNWSNLRPIVDTSVWQFPHMEFAFVKREARQERYKSRSRKARFYARLVMLALIGTSGFAAWQDEAYGPVMKQYTLTAMENFEAVTDEDSTSRKIVQAAISKLDL